MSSHGTYCSMLSYRQHQCVICFDEMQIIRSVDGMRRGRMQKCCQSHCSDYWTQSKQTFERVRPLVLAAAFILMLTFLSFQMNVNCARRDISVVGNNNVVHFNAHTDISNATCRVFESSLSTDIVFWIIFAFGISLCIGVCYCCSRNRMPRDRDRAMPCSNIQTIAHV